MDKQCLKRVQTGACLLGEISDNDRVNQCRSIMCGRSILTIRTLNLGLSVEKSLTENPFLSKNPIFTEFSLDFREFFPASSMHQFETIVYFSAQYSGFSLVKFSK